MRTAFIEALCELAAARPARLARYRRPGIFRVGAHLPAAFPTRFLNAGVAEQNMTGVAAGLALSDCVVFTYSIANFPTLRCLEQIRNDVCYHRANVKIVAVGGGFTYASSGYTHHGLEDLSILSSLPEMTVVAARRSPRGPPGHPAIAERDGPCYLRLGKAGEPVSPRRPAGVRDRPGDLRAAGRRRHAHQHRRHAESRPSTPTRRS